jgi:hypothetical protein
MASRSPNQTPSYTFETESVMEIWVNNLKQVKKTVSVQVGAFNMETGELANPGLAAPT